MRPPYKFKASKADRAFCDRIAKEMMDRFGFPAEEAVGRINQQWAGVDFTKKEIDLRYHEDPTYWANTITFGTDSFWWLDPPELKPRPYPAPKPGTTQTVAPGRSVPR